MSLLGRLRSATAAITAGAMIFTAASAMPEREITADAASVCSINTNKTYQYIRGFGGIDMQEWQGYTLSEAERATAFGNGDNQLGLTVLRVFVNPDSSKWNLAVPVAKYASEHGATVFATPWEPPSNLAESGGSNGKLHLPKSNYGAYAKHLNDFGTFMKNNGVDLYSISVQNEPDYASEWTYWSPDETTDFIANYGDQITSTRLMSPETFQYGAWSAAGRNYYNNILNNQKAMANVDVFGTHFYGTPRNKMDFPELENSGKEIWMTEVYVPNSTANSANNWPEAIEVAENIHNGLVVGNMSVYTWWYIKRSYSLISQDGTNGSITKRGYMMAQYSKYVRPGDIRIDATESPQDKVYISAFKHSDTQIEVVAVNMGSDYAQQFSVDNRKITGVDRYRTTANENLAYTKGLDHETSTFYAQLPANSVSTFIVTLESDGKDVPDIPDGPVTPEPDEPDENGYYFHDTFENGTCDWEKRGSSSITLSGRDPYAGQEALLVQDRASAWNGVQKSLNSATYKAGETYSFSVCAEVLDGAASTDLQLSLQYTDSAGDTKYAHIATATGVIGNYVQLANTNYTIPEGASNLVLYVETVEGTDNFYIDEAIAAVAGTKIDGPKEITFTLGDVDNSGVINAVDISLARAVLVGNSTDAVAKLAADVDQNGKVEIADIVQLQQYVLGMIKGFTKGETPVEEDPIVIDDPVTSLTMAEYTAKIQSNVVEIEPNDSHTEKGGVQYGTIQSGTYYSTTCNRNKPYNILLPAGYDSSKQYPVLYVMHGYWENQDRMIIKGNGTMATRQIIGNAIAEGAAKDMIVVFPYIYSSATQADCTAMDDANNAAYDNFINDLTKDLMPYIESHYSVKTGRDNTAITGFSMGGRESLLIGMKRPDLFGYIGAICPAPGVTGSFKWDSSSEPHLLFITAGSNDTVVYSNPETYHNNFTQNGVPHIWHYVNGGYHGDNSIHAHLYNFVRAIFQ